MSSRGPADAVAAMAASATEVRAARRRWAKEGWLVMELLGYLESDFVAHHAGGAGRHGAQTP